MTPFFLRLHPVVGGAAGSLGSRFSAHGCGSTGALRRSAQPAGPVPCQTGPAVSAGGLEQGGVLLHHSAGPPGGRGSSSPPLFYPWNHTFSSTLIHFLLFQVLIRYWQPVTGAPCLWSVRHAPWSIWFPLLCFLLHFICWAIICSIVIIFDYPELMGIKQVN